MNLPAVTQHQWIDAVFWRPLSPQQRVPECSQAPKKLWDSLENPKKNP
jgi:hypothetical protein